MYTPHALEGLVEATEGTQSGSDGTGLVEHHDTPQKPFTGPERRITEYGDRDDLTYRDEMNQKGYTTQELDEFGLHPERVGEKHRRPKRAIDQRKEQALSLLRRGLTVAEAAKLMDITKFSVYVWRDRDPEFKAAMDSVRVKKLTQAELQAAYESLENAYETYEGPLDFNGFVAERTRAEIPQ